MQKIRNSILDKMIEHKLSSAEIDFLIYISRFQDDAGKVTGVHYKELCKEMGLSYQSFYNIKTSLIEKGFILSEKKNRLDHDIIIVGNEFLSEGDIQGGYINTSHDMFYKKDFFKMRAGAKLLAMDLFRLSYVVNNQHKIGTKKFFEKYTKLFQVSKRIMRSYLMELKRFFSIGIVKGNYYIRPKTEVYHSAGGKAEIDNFTEHWVKVACRRDGIGNKDKKAFQDVCNLRKQYQSAVKVIGKNFWELLNDAIAQSVRDVYGQLMKVRNLKPKYVHKILRGLIEA